MNERRHRQSSLTLVNTFSGLFLRNEFPHFPGTRFDVDQGFSTGVPREIVIERKNIVF
jgi:hypothetical protein